MARRARRRFRGGRVIDVGGGHGLLAHLMRLLDAASTEAIVVDPAIPPSAARIHEALARTWPALGTGTTFLRAGLESGRARSRRRRRLQPRLRRAHRPRARRRHRRPRPRGGAALLPRSGHVRDRVARGMGRLRRWRSTSAGRAARACWVTSVWTQMIPGAVTPKNRLLLGAPRSFTRRKAELAVDDSRGGPPPLRRVSSRLRPCRPRTLMPTSAEPLEDRSTLGGRRRDTALDLVALTPLMAQTSGRPEIAIGLVDGPVALDHADLVAGNIREVATRAGATCARADSFACQHGTRSSAGDSGCEARFRCPGHRSCLHPAGAPDLSRDTVRRTRRCRARVPSSWRQPLCECIDAGARLINLSAALAAMPGAVGRAGPSTGARLRRASRRHCRGGGRQPGMGGQHCHHRAPVGDCRRRLRPERRAARPLQPWPYNRTLGPVRARRKHFKPCDQWWYGYRRRDERRGAVCDRSDRARVVQVSRRQCGTA